MTQFNLIIDITDVLFMFIYCCLSFGNGENTVTLTNTETSIGATATLQCKSSTSSIEWHHLALGNIINEIVYQDGFIFNGYKERFSVNREDNDEYSLVINNVQITDAGKYTCVEKSEVVLQKSSELVVFEHYPSNKFCAAKYTCTPTCDDLELICSMKAHGNIIPSMEWRESTKGILTSNSRTENGTNISFVHVDLQQNHSDIRSYTCRVKYPLDFSMTTQFSWSYLVTVPVAPTPSSSDEKLHVESRVDGFFHYIAVIVASLTMIIIIIINILIILRYRHKRNTGELANSTISTTGNTKYNGSNDNEIGPMLENRHLSTPEDQDINSSGFVPRTPSNKNKSIYGVGVLDDEVFLVTRDGVVIEVFDLESRKFKRAWMVEGLINPNDMATCPSKSFIFFCDWKKAGRRSEIFGCDKNGKVNVRWTCDNERGRISIDKNTNVIVAEKSFNIIYEYTYFGTRVTICRTGKEKFHLEHAVRLENGNFVACFGDVLDDIREICIIDSHEKTLKSINQDLFQQFGVQLWAPTSLAVDKEGNIYVSDYGKIILLSSELMYKGKIDEREKEESLRVPLRICIHESHNMRQLMVADSVKKNDEWTDGRIVALNLVFNSHLTMKQAYAVIHC